jgi:hypothetical protein
VSLQPLNRAYHVVLLIDLCQLFDHLRTDLSRGELSIP